MALEVRRGTPADIDRMVELAAALHAEAPNYCDEPFEPEVLRRWLAHRMHGTLLVDDNAVFVAESAGALVGALVGIVCDRPFNRQRFAAELTLYVRPESRGGRALPALVGAFEAWARAQGASKATLGISTGIHVERTVRAYSRLGYTLDGHNATKTL